MIQFNLLPDVKLQYIKAQRNKRLVMGVSVIVAATALAVFVLLFMSVNVLQKQHINNLNKDIKNETAKLQSVADLDKILTVQNQLKSLPELNETKPSTARLFDYLVQLTPSQVNLSAVDVDFTAQTINITGDGQDLASVNKFVDTLKFTEYTIKGEEGTTKAFSEVVLTSFGKDGSKASYQIGFKFDPTLFDNTKAVSLKVPKIISTRSETEKPEALFQSQAKPDNSGGTN